MITGSHTITNIRSKIIILFRNLSGEYIYRANSKHAGLLKNSVKKTQHCQLNKTKGDKLLSHAIWLILVKQVSLWPSVKLTEW